MLNFLSFNVFVIVCLDNSFIFYKYAAFHLVAMQNNATANGNSDELKDNGNPQPSTGNSIHQYYYDNPIIDINSVQSIPAQHLPQPLVNTMIDNDDIIDISSDDDDDDDVIFLPSSPQHQVNQVHNQNAHSTNNSQLPYISHQNIQHITSNHSSDTQSRKSLELLICIGNLHDSTQNLFGHEEYTPEEPIVFRVDDNEEEDDDNEEIISDLSNLSDNDSDNIDLSESESDESESDESESDESESDESDLNDNESDNESDNDYYYNPPFANVDFPFESIGRRPSFQSLIHIPFFHFPTRPSSSNSRPIYNIDDDSDDEENNSNSLSQNKNESTIKSDNSGKMYYLLLISINRTSYECPICMEHPVKPLSTICGHIFCKKCLRELFNVNN